MLALITALVSTLFMTGLVWFCQLVAYPLLGRVPSGSYREYQRSHMVRTLPLVTIPMILEGASGLALVCGAVPAVPPAWSWCAFALSIIIWTSTWAFQAPHHFALARAWSPVVHGDLVRYNWIRTVAWSLRAVLLVGMLVGCLR